MLSRFLAVILFFSQSFNTFAYGENILFIDMNQGDLEIAQAERSAERRYDDLYVFPRKNEKFDQKKLEALLSKKKFSSIVISGHSGGNVFHGKNGKLEMESLVTSLERTQNTDARSLYLLGCNTANKSKLFYWKSALPNLKFIAGYDGTAPLSHNQTGIDFFGDTLEKEDSIVHTNHKDDLKYLLENLSGIQNLNIGIYAVCEDIPGNHEFIFMPRRDKPSERFTTLNQKECRSKIGDYLRIYSEKLRKYFSGELEPTTEDPKNSFLKEAYKFIRQNEHCFKLKGADKVVDVFSGDSLLFLVFTKEFNHNFSEYYQSLIEDSIEILDLALTDVDKIVDEIYMSKMKDMKTLEETLQNFDLFKTKAQAEIEKLNKDIKSILEGNLQFKRCLDSRSQECTKKFYKLESLYMAKLRSRDQLKSISKTYLQSKIDSLKKIQKEDIKKFFLNNRANMEESKGILQKMLTTPDKITRKDIFRLSYSFNIPGVKHKAPQALRTAISAAQELTDEFPFSWYQRDPDIPLESPNLSLRLEEITKDLFELPKNEMLANVIKASSEN